MISNNNKQPFISPNITVQDLSLALFSATQKLKKTNQELIQLQQMQEEMFFNISHDLRSPITAIHSSIDYLLSLNSLTDQEIDPTLNLIKHKLLILENLINDLFLLSSIDLAYTPLNLQEVNIGIFLEEFFFDCQIDKKYSERKLILDVPLNASYISTIDCKLILRVLDNLFSNALKFSKTNSCITLSLAQINSQTVLISIKDTGIGINPEHLQKIFTRTYMVNTARTPKQATSYGLGLTIAKSIVERHQGTIWCESEEGLGSTFYFTLPITSTLLSNF